MTPFARLTVGALSAIVAAGAIKNGWPASARSADPPYPSYPTYLSYPANLSYPQQQFPTAQYPLFRAGASLVAVDAYPIGPDGKIREGLTPTDFEVTEDGKPQSVELFEFLKFEPVHDDTERRDPQTAEEGDRLAGDPRHRAFVAYFDSYDLTTAGTEEMRQPIVDFLEHTIGRDDYFAAMNPDTPPSTITFGQRTETIAGEVTKYTALAQLTFDRVVPITAHEQWLADCYRRRWPDVRRDDQLMAALLARWRIDLVLNSLTGLTARLASIREERTNVILMADGWTLSGPNLGLLANLWHQLPQPGVVNGRLQPNGEVVKADGPPDSDRCDGELSRLAEADFNDDFRKLRENALRRNVAFYPISPAGLEAFGDTLMTNPKPFQMTEGGLDVLRVLAVNTNGKAIVRTNDIRTPIRELSDLFGSYYLLGYYTTNQALDGKYRTIEVKVKAPGVKVTARHGYVASPNPVLTSTRVDAAEVSPETAALGALSALESSPSLVATGTAASGEVVVVAEVSGAAVGAIADGADVKVTVTGASGAAPIVAAGRIDKGARSGLVRVPIGTAPGPWRAQIDVGKAADDLSTSVTVPAANAASAAIVGEPILYRATPSPRSPLWPSASHVFSRTERLHVEWPIAGPLDSRTARLLDRRGQPLAVGVSLTEAPNATRPTLVGDVSLGPLAPGDYLLELVAGRGGVTERRLVAIRVGP